MSLPEFAGNISSCTQYSRRAAPLDPSPVMQSCAARLNARLTRQSVNCELLCIIDLATFIERVQAVPLRIFPSVSNDNGFVLRFALHTNRQRTSCCQQITQQHRASAMFWPHRSDEMNRHPWRPTN